MTSLTSFPRIGLRGLPCALVATVVAGVGACQDYEHVFQPDTHREGVHLRFEVQQPSLADILFVVDNSISMANKQAALKASFNQMVDFLSGQDTAYRIGIVSTDVRGQTTDCCQVSITQAQSQEQIAGGRGNCQRCTCVTQGASDCNDTTDSTDCPAPLVCDPTMAPEDPANAGRCVGKSCQDCLLSGVTCEPEVLLRRPHDGTRGRLIAAYDPAVFDLNATDEFGAPLYPPTLITPGLEAPFQSFFPDPNNTPALQVPWVIDRLQIREQACAACGCPEDQCAPTADDPVCFEQCAKPVTKAAITAYFTSNLNGLGISGLGYEEGLKAALWAVGIDPMANTEEVALNPGSYLTVPATFATPAGPNTYEQIDPLTGLPSMQSWVRPNALLAVMFVTDEEDCSMTSVLDSIKDVFEGQVGEPRGSVCYQEGLDAQFLSRTRMAQLLTAFKGSPSRLTVGLIGGVRQSGPPGAESRQGTAADCVTEDVPADAEPSNACACLSVPPEAPDPAHAWCPYTDISDPSGSTPPLPMCDTLAANRYVEFTSQFRRKTFDSVCRGCPDSGPCEAYGPALVEFARLATEACFELGDVRPANCTPQNASLCDPTLIEVKHATRDEVEAGIPPSLLQMVDPDTTQPPEDGGWYYEPAENQICLKGLDRAVGDVYEIFILHTDDISFTH